MPHAFFVSYGSYGDIFPFLAVAQRLGPLGVTCAFATNHRNTEILEKAGFTAHGIVPDAREVLARQGLDEDNRMAALHSGTDTLWKAVFPYYADQCDLLEDLVGDADVIIAPAWAHNAQAVAEKRGIPFVGVHLWPLSILSASDPPLLRGMPQLIQTPTNAVAIVWNRILFKAMRRALVRRYAPIITPLRKKYGLGPLSRAPLFEFQCFPVRTLTLVSSLLAPAELAKGDTTEITGFPTIIDPSDPLDPDLQSFLNKRPIIFSLGSTASTAPGAFYETSAKVARRLGRPALLLMDDPDQIDQCERVRAAGYVPHAEVFPHASVIVHHGGIGTTAHALAAGHPQLVVPHFGDQPDNAARLKRLGVAEVLNPEDYRQDAAERVLTKLLSTPAYAERAKDAKTQIDQEDGAQRAADVIADVIGTAKAA